MLKRILWLGWLFSMSLSAQAATYYVSNGGSDANDGLSPQTAWQTLAPLNEVRFNDDDRILFERGGTFRGSARLRGSPKNMYFGPYGDENLPKPAFAGSEVVTGWQPSSRGNGIWEASVAGVILPNSDGELPKVKHLFFNDEVMTIARYPNVDSPLDKNWLKVDVKGTNSFTDRYLVDEYRKPKDYWKGAMVRIRIYSWTLTMAEIRSFNNTTGRITVEGNYIGDLISKWGYFIDNILTELDHPGEWYHDVEAQKIYFYPPIDPADPEQKKTFNPNNALIEAAVYNNGLNVNSEKNNTLIENLVFKQYMGDALHINNSSNVTVQFCDFFHNVNGLTTYNAADFHGLGNFFNWHFRSSYYVNAASKFDPKDSVFEYNTVLNNALHRIYGRVTPGSYQGIGVRVFGAGQTVRFNRIENIGHAGIYLKGEGGHLIERNYVNNSMLIINDGGAISVGADDNIMRGNFLMNTWGNIDESNGCATERNDPCVQHPPYGMGIGADPGYTGNVIEDNVVANNTDMGIRLNAFKNTVVRNNVVFNNDPQIVVQDKKGTSRNNTVEGNLVVSMHPEQLGLELTNKTNHGTFRNNTYVNFFNELSIMRDGERFSLKHYRDTYSGQENGSTTVHLSDFDFFSYFHLYRGNDMGGGLLPNGDFSLDLSGGWNSTRVEHSTENIDGGTEGGGILQAEHTGTRLLNITSPDFTVVKGQWYRFKFSVRANDDGDIRLRLNETPPGEKSIILEERYLAVDNKRRDYEFFFQAPENYSNTKFLFILDQQDKVGVIRLDNVSLVPVSPRLYNAQDLVKLVYNPDQGTMTENLGNVQYFDLNDIISFKKGQNNNLPVLTGRIDLPEYSYRILVRADFNTVGPEETLPAPSSTVQLSNAGVQDSAARFVGGFMHESKDDENISLFSTSLPFKRHIEVDLNQQFIYQGSMIPDPDHIGQMADIVVLLGQDKKYPFSEVGEDVNYMAIELKEDGVVFTQLGREDEENRNISTEQIIKWLRDAPRLEQVLIEPIDPSQPTKPKPIPILPNFFQIPLGSPGTWYLLMGYRLGNDVVVVNGVDSPVPGDISSLQPLAITIFNATATE